MYLNCKIVYFNSSSFPHVCGLCISLVAASFAFLMEFFGESQLLTFSGHVSFRNRPMVSETKIKNEKVFIHEAKRKQFDENFADASSH